MQTYMTTSRAKRGSSSRRAGRTANIRRSPMEQLHEMHQTIGNQAVQRTVTLKDYNGDNDVVFDKPYAAATEKLLKEKAVADVGKGVVKTLREMVKDKNTDHKFDDVDDLAKDLDRQVNGGKKRKASIDKIAKAEHKKRSRQAKIVVDPNSNEVKTGRVLKGLSKVTLAALREHQKRKPGYTADFQDFQANLETSDGVDKGGTGNALKNMMMYMDHVEDKGVQELQGRIQDVSFKTNLDTATIDPNEALANTHVTLSGTKKKSAYAAFTPNNLTLPLLSDNRTQQTLNAVESTRNEGEFMFSQVGKYRALDNDWITPEEAIHPKQHGTFEISSVSGKNRNDFSDRLSENMGRTYQTLLDNNDGWTKNLEGHVNAYQDKKSQKTDKFKAMKEGSRLIVQQLGAFTDQDTLTPPSTPEYQAVEDAMTD